MAATICLMAATGGLPEDDTLGVLVVVALLIIGAGLTGLLLGLR